MVQTYTIAGKKVGSHVLAMATFAITGAITAWSMSGYKEPVRTFTGPEQEKFVRAYVASEGKSAPPPPSESLTGDPDLDEIVKHFRN